MLEGGGRRGGGGGGGKSEDGSFDLRQWLANLAQGLSKTGSSLGKTVAAVLLLLSIFYASNFIRPLTRATINGLRWVLRLDGAGSRRVGSFLSVHPKPPTCGSFPITALHRKCNDMCVSNKA